ncbi:MAG: tetratricopeptide repeat protein, partial [Flavobacteriales bacterium]
MVRKSKALFLIVIGCLLARPVSSQTKLQTELDSLLRAFEKEKSDTQQVNILHKCAGVSLYYSDYKQARKFTTQAAQKLAEIDWQSGLADNAHYKAIMAFYEGNYTESLNENYKALKIRKQLNDYAGMATSYGNIGLIYQVKADYENALKYQLKGLKIEEKRKNLNGIAISYTNIGLIFEHLGEYEKARQYYFKNLKIREKQKDSFNLARVHSNLGNAYYSLKDLEKALEHYEISMEIAVRIEDRTATAVALANIGNMYYEKKEYQKALECQLECIKIVEETGDTRVWVACMGNAGENYLYLGQIDKAFEYATKSLKKAREMETPDLQMSSLSTMVAVQEKKGNWQNAYELYKEYMAIRDTISNEERSKEVARKEIQYEFDKREEKRKLLDREKSRKQQIIIYSVSLGLLLVLVFAVFIFRSLKANKKKGKIIQEQKTLVEAKQKEILDSINYAKKIQYALLAHDDLLKANLPEHFVLFKPKDIVSGDFYWAT